jgi:hypothetical protein
VVLHDGHRLQQLVFDRHPTWFAIQICCPLRPPHNRMSRKVRYSRAREISPCAVTVTPPTLLLHIFCTLPLSHPGLTATKRPKFALPITHMQRTVPWSRVSNGARCAHLTVPLSRFVFILLLSFYSWAAFVVSALTMTACAMTFYRPPSVAQ